MVCAWSHNARVGLSMEGEWRTLSRYKARLLSSGAYALKSACSLVLARFSACSTTTSRFSFPAPHSRSFKGALRPFLSRIPRAAELDDSDEAWTSASKEREVRRGQ